MRIATFCRLSEAGAAQEDSVEIEEVVRRRLQIYLTEMHLGC